MKLSVKRFALCYFVLAIGLVCSFCYLYNNGLTSGYKFHNLTAFSRNMVRVEGLLTVIVSPFSALFGYFFPGKLIFNSSAWWDVCMFLGILSSYMFYSSIIFKRNIFKLN